MFFGWDDVRGKAKEKGNRANDYQKINQKLTGKQPFGYI
jgi:hypothetical protein